MISAPEISHALHRAATVGPDSDQTWRDDAGQTWFRFAVDYSFEGRTFSAHIWARGVEDAELRLAALRETGRVLGQVYVERDT